MKSRFNFVLPATILALGLAGCAGLNNTEQRVLSGGALGAGVGAAGAALTDGNPVAGGLIGAGVGAAAGYIYDQSQYD